MNGKHVSRDPAAGGRTPGLYRLVVASVVAAVLATAAVLAAACAGDTGPAGQAALAPDNRPWAADPPGEAVLEATSGDDVFLSYVWELATDSRGRVFVIDGQESAVIALNADLTYARMIGREGEGPGEFQRPARVQVLAADSVLVWDSNLQRVTVFPPDGDEPAYAYSPGDHTRLGQVRRLTGSPGYLSVSSTAYMADGSDQGETRAQVLRHVREEGGELLVDDVVDYPADDALVLRGEGYVSMAGHPFARRSFVGVLTGDRIAHVSSDALAVRVFDLDGQVLSAFSYETTTIAVTRAELDAATDRLRGEFGRLLREGAPYVWPTLTGLVVDDEDRIWVGIRGNDRSQVEWAAFRPDGSHAVSVLLPSEFEVYAVRGGRILGVAADEMDISRVEAYRLP